VGDPESQRKPFDISKRLVWEAYLRVKDNKGAPGVDGCSIEDFEADLRNNLYRLWNRMSSGSYFPPPVKAVEIPKSHGGVRILGVPTVADRIAQTVVAMELERRVEPMFHPDSFGYRPRRSALDAVGVCRERCWKYDWVVDLDVEKFFDSVDHSLMVKAVEANTDQPWVVLYKRKEVNFTSFQPAISGEKLTEKSREVRRWRLHRRPNDTLDDLAREINPMVRGWMTYWGRYYRTEMDPLLKRINTYLMRWARKKYKRLRGFKRLKAWWKGVTHRDPTLFAHWTWTHRFHPTGW
jgi:retron-type reverse transcriptase